MLRGETGGRVTQAWGEVVFNTCMSGYQEVLSDPSYAGQMVVMTYPLIGNYGVDPAWSESARPWARAVIVRQLSRIADHWSAPTRLEEWLDAWGVPIVTGVDTRRLVRHLRGTGTLRGVVAPWPGDSPELREELAARARAVTPLEEQDLVGEVSRAFEDCLEPLDAALAVQPPPRRWPQLRVAVVDLGVKRNILRSLRARGVEVIVHRYDVSAPALLAGRPDAVVLSNGPGDPARLESQVRLTRELLGRVPILGICLGHQLVARAVGARTRRLRFGHHGGNHPVMDLRSGRVTMTSQNHEFEVEEESLPTSG